MRTNEFAEQEVDRNHGNDEVAKVVPEGFGNQCVDLGSRSNLVVVAFEASRVDIFDHSVNVLAEVLRDGVEGSETIRGEEKDWGKGRTLLEREALVVRKVAVGIGSDKAASNMGEPFLCEHGLRVADGDADSFRHVHQGGEGQQLLEGIAADGGKLRPSAKVQRADTVVQDVPEDKEGENRGARDRVGENGHNWRGPGEDRWHNVHCKTGEECVCKVLEPETAMGVPVGHDGVEDVELCHKVHRCSKDMADHVVQNWDIIRHLWYLEVEPFAASRSETGEREITSFALVPNERSGRGGG